MRFLIPLGAAFAALVVAASAAAWPSGGPAPEKTLAGGATGLNNIQGIAVSGSGTTFAVNYNASPQTVTAYDGDWANGNSAPSKTLSGAATGLHDPYDVAVDSSGRMYVANLNGDITVHAANWAGGNTAPIRTITEYGSNTQLVDALALTVKDDGTIYAVQNRNSGFFGYVGDVLVYGPTANGNVAPIQVISGGANAGNTGLSYASGIAVDGDGLIYVAASGSGVKVFAANASGNATPVKTLSGNAYRVVFDDSGRLYVVDDGGTIRVYAPGFASGAAPIKTLSGGSTGFGEPRDAAFDASGRMYVGTSGNSSPTSVRVFSTSYQSITFPAMPDAPLSSGTVVASASSSSTGTVAFTSATPAVCTSGGSNGATISLVAAGTCTVQASQAGDATWNPATPVDRSFSVTAAAPSPDPSPEPSNATAPSGASATATGASPTAATPSATLSARILPSRTRLVRGQSMRLGIRTINNGASAASGVTSCVRLPAGLTVVAGGPGVVRGRTLCMTATTLAAGDQATRVFTVRAAGAGIARYGITAATQASGITPVAAAPVTVVAVPRSGWDRVTG